MKYVALLLFLISGGLITYGYLTPSNDAQKFIGSGVAVLFLLAFPFFTYYRWKDKDIKDYMLTKENLDKMRAKEKDKTL